MKIPISNFDKKFNSKYNDELFDQISDVIKFMHKKYVKPSERFADVVLGEVYDYELIKIKIDELLNGNFQKN